MEKSACVVCVAGGPFNVYLNISGFSIAIFKCQQKRSAAPFLLFRAELFHTILLLTTSSQLD